MKLVTVKSWDDGQCEASHKDPVPSIVRIGVKGIDFELCARHAAQLIKELSVPLGEWADRSVKFEVGYHSGDPLSDWPPRD